MDRETIHRVIREMRDNGCSVGHETKEKLLNYLECNVDDIIDCYEEGEIK